MPDTPIEPKLPHKLTQEEQQRFLSQENDTIRFGFFFLLIVGAGFVWSLIADEDHMVMFILWVLSCAIAAGTFRVVLTPIPTTQQVQRPSFGILFLLSLLVSGFVATLLNDRLVSRVQEALERAERSLISEEIIGPNGPLD